MGLVLGWLDGPAEIDGYSEGMEDGWADTLGDSDGPDDGTPVLVGPTLGWLDGRPDTGCVGRSYIQQRNTVDANYVSTSKPQMKDKNT